jgi:pimeloyl-ACP methyl ester carboxylesterase
MNEKVILFGEDQRLVGTLLHVAPSKVEREGPPVSGLAVLTFNAGLIPRTGPHRLWVKLARHLASSGMSTLRFDLSGQGDSSPATSTQAFEPQAVDDICSAIAAVQEQTGIKRFVLIGICSGAALGYQAALKDPRIVGCAMIDIYMYTTWRTHWVRIKSRIRSEGFSTVVSGWLAKLGRQGRRGAGGDKVSKGPPSALPGLHRPTEEAFASGLQQLLDRQAKLLLIYTGSFLYRYNYADQFQDRFRRFRLKGPLRVEFDPAIDHTVTEKSAQHKLIRHLEQWLQTI